MKRPVAFAFLICLLLTRPAMARSQSDDEPEANPGRPTVSTPATLTSVGYLQFESGFTGAHNSPEFSSLYSFNEVLKLSVTRRLQLLAWAEPVAHFTVDGTIANRVADVFLGAQGVLSQGEGPKPTLAIGADATSSFPPVDFIRSRMLVSPRPVVGRFETKPTPSRLTLHLK